MEHYHFWIFLIGQSWIIYKSAMFFHVYWLCYYVERPKSSPLITMKSWIIMNHDTVAVLQSWHRNQKTPMSSSIIQTWICLTFCLKVFSRRRGYFFLFLFFLAQACLFIDVVWAPGWSLPTGPSSGGGFKRCSMSSSKGFGFHGSYGKYVWEFIVHIVHCIIMYHLDLWGMSIWSMFIVVRVTT